MRTFTRKDISYIKDKIISQNESIELFAGSGSDKKVVVKRGLKIRHKPSGLIYTVVDAIFPDSGEPEIICHRPGKRFRIKSKDFNEYERL